MKSNLLYLMFSRENCVAFSLSVTMNVLIYLFVTVCKIVGGSDNIPSSRSPRFLNTTYKPRSHISIIVPVHSLNLDNMFIGRYPIFLFNIINVLSPVLRNLLLFSQKSFSTERYHRFLFSVIGHLSHLIVIKFSRKINISPCRSLCTHVFFLQIYNNYIKNSRNRIKYKKYN